MTVVVLPWQQSRLHPLAVIWRIGKLLALKTQGAVLQVPCAVPSWY